MTLPLWGLQEKALDDPTTIDEAIAAAIADHNADPEAHLASGESLEEHKTETVIDHPAGSVLADKQSMTELAVTTIFESLDGWSTFGEVSNSDIPGLTLYIEDGSVEASFIGTTPQAPLNFRDSSKNMVFQTLARFSLGSNSYNSYLGYFSGLSDAPSGFGFLVKSGVLTAYAKQSTNINESSSISVDLTLDHVYRAYLDAGRQEIDFYVDGTLVATLDVPGSGWEDDSGPAIWIENISGNDGNLYIAELYFSREI